MRTQQKKFLVVICAVIMFTWVIGGAIGRLLVPTGGPGGKVFGRSVSGNELALYVRCLSLIAPRWYPRNAPVMAGLAWHVKLLVNEAQGLGLKASDQEVDKWLRRLFPGPDGSINAASYQSNVSYLQAPPSDFERVLRDWIVSRKVEEMVRTSTMMCQAEAWRWWSRMNAEATVRYAFLDAKKLTPFVSVTEKEIERQYERGRDLFPKDAPNGSGYKEPQRVQIEYTTIGLDGYMKTVKVSPKEIEEYYQEHKTYRYRLPPEKDETDKKDKKADKDAKDAKGKKGEEKAKEEKPKAPRYRPLKEVTPEIEAAIRKEKAKEEATKVRKQIMDELARQMHVPLGSTADPKADLAPVAAKFGLKWRKSGWFTKEEVPAVLPGVRQLHEGVFDGTKRSMNEPQNDVETDKYLLAYQVKGVKLSGPAPLKDVRKRVVADARMMRAAVVAGEIVRKAIKKKTFAAAALEIRDLVRKLEEKSKAGEKTGKDAKTATAKSKAKTEERFVHVATTQPFGRPIAGRGGVNAQVADVKGKGLNRPELAEEAFKLRIGEMGAALAKGDFSDQVGAYAVELLDMRRPDKQEYVKDGEWMRPLLLRRKRSYVARMWRSDLLRRAKPSPKVLQALVELRDAGIDWPVEAAE